MALTDTGSARLAFIRGSGIIGGSGGDGGVAIAASPVMQTMPFTSESLSKKLTSAQSAAMRDDRQFAGSRLVRGESSGDIGLEVAAGFWLDELLSGVLQTTAFPANPSSSDSDAMVNGQTKTFFLFEKRLEAESGMQFTTFQDCQVSMMSFDVQANSLANMSISLLGLDAVNGTSQGGGSYSSYDLDDQMDTNSASLEFKTSGDVDIDVTAQSFSLALDNQMRGQQAVGYFFNAGNASGRFKTTMSASVYFRNMDLYTNFVNNTGFKVFLTLSDTAGNYYKFAMENVKVTSHDISAGGADQDLIASLELQAFPASSAADKTLTVTRYTA